MLFLRTNRLLRRAANAIVFASHYDIFSWNTKITACCERGDIDSARRMFDDMPQRNVVTWNCMISGFVKNHLVSEARKVFDVMPAKNVVSWTVMLRGYIGCGSLEEARNLFDQIPTEVKNVDCWNVMLNGYIRHGRIAEARELFDEAPQRNVRVYNRMLSGYVQMGYVEEAYMLFVNMPQRDVASWTTMITCFARAGQMQKARNMFEEMPFEKDVTCWTAMIQGFMRNGMVEEACNLFYRMPHRDVVVWNCMITGLVQNSRLKEALAFYEKMPWKDIVSSNSILRGLLQEEAMINAQYFFDNVMPQKDVASWNTLISGYQPEVALFLYSQMLRHGFKPDQITYASLISGCGKLCLQSLGKATHLCVIKTGYASDAMVISSLISMYSKCGLISDAAFLFGRLEERDTVVWNAMIVAHAYHGSVGNALNLFSSMIQAACKPNHATFLAILTACAHWGKVEEGQRYIGSMVKDWNIVPEPEHYACMVDLLGRSGLLYEAHELVLELPADFSAYIWETLLNCCKMHGNLELGQLVAQKVLANDASNAEMNVLLSNVYAAKELWDKAASIRTMMKHCDAIKEVAFSWIELGGTVCKFVYNDRSHPETEEIYREVEKLSIMVK